MYKYIQYLKYLYLGHWTYGGGLTSVNEDTTTCTYLYTSSAHKTAVLVVPSTYLYLYNLYTKKFCAPQKEQGN